MIMLYCCLFLVGFIFWGFLGFREGRRVYLWYGNVIASFFGFFYSNC